MSGEAKTPLASAKKGRSSAAVIAGVAVVALAAGGGAAWFLSRHSTGAQAASSAAAVEAPKYLVHLEGFTVNLNDPEQTHFLRVTIDLGLDHSPPAADREKPSSSLPVARIRDTILSVLTLCQAQVLLTPEGKSELKKDLLDALKRNVPEIGVREVYFTEFLVQR